MVLNIKNRFLTSVFGAALAAFNLSSAFAGWSTVEIQNLSATLGENASRVNGVQVVAYRKGKTELDTQLVVGRLSEHKDKSKSWALSSGKPNDSDKTFEDGAYRELFEEFGIPENWGTKQTKALVNDTGKFGIKLVFFLALNHEIDHKSMMDNMLRDKDGNTEYTEVSLVNVKTFEGALQGTADEPTYNNFRKFDQRMFSSQEAMNLLKQEMGIFDSRL